MWPEDALYERWKHADEGERPGIEQGIAGYVSSHLKKAIMKKYHLSDEDVVQIATMAALEHIREFEGRNGAAFSSWSHKIALHKAVDEIERRTRERGKTLSIQALVENEEEWDPPDPAYFDPVIRIAYERKLELLTKPQRQVWDLEQEGYAGKEIAKRLEITPEAVDNRLRRARKKLQEN